MDATVLVAIVGTIGTVVATTLGIIANRKKTASEAQKLTVEGNADMMTSASAFLQQSGEYGQRLMERVQNLEAAIQKKDEENDELSKKLHIVEAHLSSYKDNLDRMERALDLERERRMSAQQDVARLEAIVMAFQTNIGTPETPNSE